MQIRHALSHLVPDAKALQMTVVEDAGTLHRLSKIILGLRSGRAPEEQDDQHQLMLELAKEYSQLETVSSPSSDVTKPRTNTGITVLLTGPTGSLGSHILHQLLSDQRVLHIYLLVRGASLHAARGRVLKALSTRQLSLPSDFDTKTTILQCNLSSGHLGLSDTDYKSLTNHVDVIMHLAWSVNFLLPLRSYINTHLAGLRNLLQLASFSSSSEERKSPLKFIFCSSVASTSNYLSLRNPSSSTATVRIPESFIPDPNAAGPTGYARSKWVGEAICSAVHASPNLRNRIDISIARVGQLSGASDTGIWSTSEAYPLLLSTLKVTGVLPDLKGEVCNWVPVDIAAAAFLEDALSQKPDPLGQPQGGNGNGNENGNRLSKDNDGSDTDTDTDTDVDIPVTHVLNSHNDIHWSHILTWLSATTSTSNSNSKFTPKFKIVPVHEWLSKLEELAHVHDDKTKPHPALRLLGFWKKAYGGEDSGESNDPTRDTVSSQEEEESDTTASEGENTQDYLLYDMARTYARMPVLRDAGGMVDREYCLKLWRWIDEVL
jgi:thioester reductase-like protein